MNLICIDYAQKSPADSVRQNIHPGPYSQPYSKKVHHSRPPQDALTDTCGSLAGVLLQGPHVCGCTSKGDAQKNLNLLQACNFAATKIIDECQSAQNEQSQFDLFGLNFQTLKQLLNVAEGHNCKGVFVMPANIDKVGAFHIHKLCEAFNKIPNVQVVASFYKWFNRPPYVIKTDTLRQIVSGQQSQPANNASSRPVAQLQVFEVAFGEEVLGEFQAVPKRLERLLNGAHSSALEAVRAACSGNGSQKPYAAQAHTHAHPNKMEALIEKCAQQTALLSNKVSTKIDTQELVKWDAWAHTNKFEFPIFSSPHHENSLVYLDSAATSQRLNCAIEAQHRFDAYENANVYRGTYSLSSNSTKAYAQAHADLLAFVDAPDDALAIFTTNATQAANLAATSWGNANVEAGDLIVTTIEEHHSNIVPWQMLAQRKRARLAFVPVAPDGTLDMHALDQLLAMQPKIVCVAQVSNMLGIKNPVAKITQAAHAVGAKVFVDAAQSFPHMKISMAEIGCDFLSLSAHKAYAPFGIGALCVTKQALQEMRPYAGGGGTISHVAPDATYFRGAEIQYELGTPAISQAVGFSSALNYLSGLGMQNVEAHHRALTKYLVAMLEQMGNVTIWGNHTSENGQCGLVSFCQNGIPSMCSASILGLLGVSVRGGGHCALPLHASMGLGGSVRISFGIHTTVEDINAAICALLVCQNLYFPQDSQ